MGAVNINGNGKLALIPSSVKEGCCAEYRHRDPEIPVTLYKEIEIHLHGESFDQKRSNFPENEIKGFYDEKTIFTVHSEWDTTDGMVFTKDGYPIDLTKYLRPHIQD